MSRTTIYAFPVAGPGVKVCEFANSWGSASRIWTSLSEKYLGDRNAWLGDLLMSEKLWKLRDDSRLSNEERLVLLSTFDRALIPARNFTLLAAAFRKFAEQHPTEGVCHLRQFAVTLDLIAAGQLHLSVEPAAVGFHQTSVSINPWWNEDEERLYDLSRDDNHFFLE